MDKKLFWVHIIFVLTAIRCCHGLCLDVRDITVCVGNKFIKGVPEKVETNKTKICFMHGENSNIPKNAFILLTKMENLYLNLTNVITISDGTFNRLGNLSVLGLHGNRITELDTPVFLPLRKLTTLDISGNDISKIQKINFRGLRNLKNLILVHNYIREITKKDFQPLPKLESLDLSLNYIESLDADTFACLQFLQTLNLNYNKIANIDDGSFRGLKRLTSLKLRGNFLQCVPTQELSRFPGLVIDVGNNRMDCAEIRSEINVRKNVTILCEN